MPTPGLPPEPPIIPYQGTKDRSRPARRPRLEPPLFFWIMFWLAGTANLSTVFLFHFYIATGFTHTLQVLSAVLFAVAATVVLLHHPYRAPIAATWHALYWLALATILTRITLQVGSLVIFFFPTPLTLVFLLFVIMTFSLVLSIRRRFWYPFSYYLHTLPPASNLPLTLPPRPEIPERAPTTTEPQAISPKD